jgi:REP-associated tyrosine transposase
MPWRLKRYQQARCLHFLTFSCFHRTPLQASPHARRIFEHTLERVRRWYGFYITGYVVMPEHVHLLLSEPEGAPLSIAVQMLKQIVGRKLHELNPGKPFWQARYYDFNVWTEANWWKS